MNDAGELRDAIFATTVELWRGFWAKLVAFVPNLVGALVLLLVGWVTAVLAGRIVRVVLERIGFDRAAARVGLAGLLAQAGVRMGAAAIVGRLVFWLLALTFLVSAAEALDLENVSRTIDAFVRYLPNAIAAAVILVVGLTIAAFVRDLIRGAARGLGVDHARALGTFAHGALVIVVAGLAIGQLGIETDLLDRLVETVLMAVAAALALGVGLGTRHVARHVVAGVYLRDQLRPGMEIAAGDASGAVQEVGPVATRLTTADGRVLHVPNGRLADAVVVVTGSSRV